MGIRYFVFAVNKMDLIEYDEKRFRDIENQIAALIEELKLANVTIIPVSATEGDNVTTKSDNMPWYKGEALLSHLETVDIKEDTEKGFYIRYRESADQIMSFADSRDRLRMVPSGQAIL